MTTSLDPLFEGYPPARGTLRVVRHAPVAVRGLCYGQSDVPVQLPADEAADRIAEQIERPPHRVVATPWERTLPVGMMLAMRWQATLTVEPALSELSMGRWESRMFDRIEAEEPEAWQRWMTHWRTEAPPGGETVADLDERVRRVLAGLRELGEDLLIVAHAGTIRAIRAAVEGGSVADRMSESVEPLRVSTVPW